MNQCVPRICTWACCLLLAAPAAAEEPAMEDLSRPRVGLVLSGGGARGLAHVGVLKVLEEQRVPIDAIAGTSMGAVIGGLYASGMTSTEIEALVRTLNWNSAFRDRPPRSDMNFRRKQDDREYLVRFPLGVKSGDFRVPRGLIQGQRLTQILRRETVAVAGIDDFDRLPTRFRAIATDLETGERKVLARGDLAEALRASLSAPGVFAPVELEGRLLVDGGLVENLPVDIAKEMGVDIVIAVDVGFQPVGRRDLNSTLAVSNQMLTIMIQRETRRQRELLSADDLLIEPALGKMLSMDFTAVDRTIEQGEAATRAQLARIAALGIDDAHWQEYLAARSGRETMRPTVQFVRADRRSDRYRERIVAKFTPAVGQPLDPVAMEQRVSQLYGDGNFELLDYKVVRDGELSGVEVSARRKSWGPNYLRFGLELQDDFEGSNSFNAGVRALVTEVNPYGAEWQTDIRVGESPRFLTEFYQPIGYTSDWFVAPKLLIERRNFDIIDEDERLATYRIRNEEIGLDLGRQFGSWGELRAGVRWGEGSRDLLVGDPDDPDLPPRTDFDRRIFSPQRRLDGRRLFPAARRAVHAAMEWPARAWAPMRMPTAFPGLDAGTLWADTYVLSMSGAPTCRGPDRFRTSTLGGLFNLSGLSPEAISGPHFAIARGIYYRRIGSGDEGFLNVPIYLGMSLELGNVWDRRSDMSFDSGRFNGSTFLGFDTFLGPVYLAAGFDEGGERSFYLMLGRIR
jgi:NTE family protein